MNTGQAVRKFTSHGAQLVGVAVRPLNTLSQRFSSISSVGVSGGSEAYPDPLADTTSHRKLTETPVSANVETFPTAAGKAHGHQQQTLNASASQNGISNLPTQESDAKSDTSFDPLFDDEPDPDGEGDNHSAPDGGVGQAKISHRESAAPDGHMGLAVPDAGASDPTWQAQAIRSSQSSVAPPKNAPPLLSAENSTTFSPDVLMVSAIDGQVMLWDKRANTPGKGVGRLWLSEKTPPWCVSVRTRNSKFRSIGRLANISQACWSTDGSHIYVGRRNGTVDVWDVRLLGRSGPSCTPRLLKSLRNPPSSGVVSCVVPFPDGRHIGWWVFMVL